jgi:Protein of unknown function (DUF3467)
MSETKEPAITHGQVVRAFTVDKALRYYGMEDVPPIYAELAAVRHSEHVFQLLFFQTVVPITDDKTEIAAMEKVPAKCIAKIIVSPKLMRDLHAAMETNMRNWERLIEYQQAQAASVRAPEPEKAEEP